MVVSARTFGLKEQGFAVLMVVLDVLFLKEHNNKITTFALIVLCQILSQDGRVC